MPVTYDRIATTTVGSTATTIEFTGIPQTYTDLRISGRFFVNNNTTNLIRLRLNNSTASSYSYNRVIASLAGGPGNYSQSSGTDDNLVIAQGPSGTGQPSIYPVGVEFDLFNYTNTNNKSALWGASFYHYETNSGNSSSAQTWRGHLLFNVNGAISSIQIYTNANAFLANTMVTLYGIKAA